MKNPTVLERCKSCWWEEGGLCYLEPVDRDERGRSKKQASGRCINYWNKRSALETAIPGEMLVITSELKK